VDPDTLVVVATGRASNAGPGLTRVGGFPGHGAGHVDDIGILRVHRGYRKISAADAPRRAWVSSGAQPAFAGVIGAADPNSLAGGHRRIEPLRITGRDRDIG